MDRMGGWKVERGKADEGGRLGAGRKIGDLFLRPLRKTSLTILTYFCRKHS
jgi:hypothetical protein